MPNFIGPVLPLTRLAIDEVGASRLPPGSGFDHNRAFCKRGRHTMRTPRTLRRSRIRPSRLGGLTAVAVLACASFASVPARAQATMHPEASPAAPGDLSKPAFDTTTPLYDMANKLENSAN